MEGKEPLFELCHVGDVVPMTKRSLSAYGSKEWANEQLSFAIQVLKGRRVGCVPKGRVSIALMVKERLEGFGFWWQVGILEIWLNRFQKGEFIARAPARAYPIRGEGGSP